MIYYRLLKYGQSLPPGDGFVEHTVQYDILPYCCQ